MINRYELQYSVKNSIFRMISSQLFAKCISARGRGVSASASARMSGAVARGVRDKLAAALRPAHLAVLDESHMHSVPRGAETHFKVVVVSDKFEGLPLIKRHRLVNDILKEELRTGVHALSIVAQTPAQWAASDQIVEGSPACRGGFGK